jgi:hypothetical protein
MAEGIKQHANIAAVLTVHFIYTLHITTGKMRGSRDIYENLFRCTASVSFIHPFLEFKDEHF